MRIFPQGTSLRFVRSGEPKADVQLAQLKRGRSMRMLLPTEVCSHVGGRPPATYAWFALHPGPPTGQEVGEDGPYNLHCSPRCRRLVAQGAAVDEPYAKLEQLETGDRPRACAQSVSLHLLWHADLPDRRERSRRDRPWTGSPEHVDALQRAISDRPVIAIMCTHTHRDHSPASRPLAERTGAPIIGCAPLALETVGPRADASFDGDYAPDRMLEDEEALEIEGKPITAVATPGIRGIACASAMKALCSPVIM